MDIEVKLASNYSNPKVIIYTDKITNEINNILNNLTMMNSKKLTAFKDEKLYILNSDDIESVYSENGKVYIKCNNVIYSIKYRLYELEEILDSKKFVRISNSEIVNFDKVKNIDFKFIGTILLNFKNGDSSYVSRRYIPKIKKFLGI